MSPYLKAVVGALVAGLGSLYQALDNSGVSTQEWVAIALATLAGFGAVWSTPWLPASKAQRQQEVQPPQRGYADPVYLLVVVVVVIILIVVLLRLV
jgi:hypothetical protein